jgi:hypothetical protein
MIGQVASVLGWAIVWLVLLTPAVALAKSLALSQVPSDFFRAVWRVLKCRTFALACFDRYPMRRWLARA